MRSRIDPDTGVDDAYQQACEKAEDDYNHPNCRHGCPHPAHVRDREQRAAQLNARAMQGAHR